MLPLDLAMWMCYVLDLQVERRVVEESFSVQQNRSYFLRNRLQQAICESPVARALERLHPCGGKYISCIFYCFLPFVVQMFILW